jgi:glycosyltransferase involved in cell wall biosynthesis
MTRKKLMLIIPEMTVGGAQRSLAKLSQELAAHAEVFLVVFNNKSDVAYPVGGILLSLDVVPGVSILSKGIALRQRIKRLRALKDKHNIDVAISFLEGADYINVLSKRKEKVVLSIRGSKVHDENMRKYFYWLRSSVLIPWLYKKADRIVAVNQGIVRELQQYHRLPESKLVTIGNFYDRDSIVDLSHEAKEFELVSLYKNKKVLVMSGRLAAEKGIHGVITMFRELVDQRRDVLLVLIGDGPERESLKQHAVKNKLLVHDENVPYASADVIFLGNRKNVFKYLQGAALYLMNSSSEGFPNGLVEAMICGIPVISSDCPYGPAEILAPGNASDPDRDDVLVAPYGVLMPVITNQKRASKWVKIISAALDDNDLRERLSAAARERTTDFDRNNVIKQWMAVISN